ncbi:MAG: hypothetical protein AVDCRST_MAG59-3291 [uncultured Thermomicrobiales bacterium]|uniref:1,4-dihydroxy-2-naphthoate octaprenyltransferase n=1 Tax=uncultured Thermomicrobiales bacterium TaxID=1645740 RepID=A0A6J4V520_9BACT|nr:MAG: hypothetical protein AVDCRST_MAG59-3291 [uncultured Thermomicrobiales bacterium]
MTPLLVASFLALAAGAFDLGVAAQMLIASVACHAGSILANDYHDHVRDIDSAELLGPSKVIQQGKLSREQVRHGMIVAFAVAAAVNLVVVSRSGWPVLALALASLVAEYAYTGGPLPLGYVALGEVAVFLAMGLEIVLGAFYVITRTVTAESVIAAIAVASLVAAILHTNNMRDTEPDRVAGERTLAILFGPPGSTFEPAGLLATAYAAAVAFLFLDAALWPASLPLVTLPLAVSIVRSVAGSPEPPSLHLAVRRCAGLHL